MVYFKLNIHSLLTKLRISPSYHEKLIASKTGMKAKGTSLILLLKIHTKGPITQDNYKLKIYSIISVIIVCFEFSFNFMNEIL